MSLSQPGSAEKTIRKIDIAQVRNTLSGRTGSTEASGLSEGAAGPDDPRDPPENGRWDGQGYWPAKNNNNS